MNTYLILRRFPPASCLAGPRRRSRTSGGIVTLAVCAVAITACGSPTSDPADVAEAAIRAIADGDGETACSYMTTAGRQAIVQGVESCPEAVERQMSLQDQPSVNRVKALEAKTVTTEGPANATVTLAGDEGGPGVDVPVVKQGDQWLVDAAPGL